MQGACGYFPLLPWSRSLPATQFNNWSIAATDKYLIKMLAIFPHFCLQLIHFHSFNILKRGKQLNLCFNISVKRFILSIYNVGAYHDWFKIFNLLLKVYDWLILDLNLSQLFILNKDMYHNEYIYALREAFQKSHWICEHAHTSLRPPPSPNVSA